MAPVNPVMFPGMPVGTTRQELVSMLKGGGASDDYWDTPDCGKEGAKIVIGEKAAVGLQKTVLTLAARLLPMSFLVPIENNPVPAPVLEGVR